MANETPVTPAAPVAPATHEKADAGWVANLEARLKALETSVESGFVAVAHHLGADAKAFVKKV
jgi:hypothetical protein